MHRLPRRHGLLLRAALVHLIVLVHLLHAQDMPVFQRGDLVRLKSQTPGYALRVIAVPGDVLDRDNARIWVNREAVRGPLPPTSGEEIWIRSMRIPDNHYYVVGEQRTMTATGTDLAQHWGLHPAANLERVPK